MNETIDNWETELWQAQSRIRKQHAPLKTRLKELSEALKISWRSSEKFQIMKEMEKIEQKIKSDEKLLLEIKQAIEQKKSRQRMAHWELQTYEYKAQAATSRLVKSLMIANNSIEKTTNYTDKFFVKNVLSSVEKADLEEKSSQLMYILNFNPDLSQDEKTIFNQELEKIATLLWLDEIERKLALKSKAIAVLNDL